MKFCFTIMVIFLSLFAMAQQSFTINGSIKGIPENTTIQLKNEDLTISLLAEGPVKQGNFMLKGSLEEANIYLLTYPGNKQRLTIFMDNSNITIKGSADSLSKAKVSGSPANDQFNEFNNEFNPLFDKLTKIAKHINEGKPDPGNVMRKDYQNTIVIIQEKTDKFLTKYPSSPVSPFVALVMTQLNTDVKITEKRFNNLAPNVQTSYYGKILDKSIAEGKIGSIGSDAIDFVQNDTSGKPVSLSSFKGKYVLLDFWASWCKPCRMENPNVVKAYNQFKDKNFTVLGVSLDRSKDSWLKAINDDGLKWTQVSDLKYWSNEAAVKYKIDMIPRNFLLDPNGKIIGKDLRGEELLNTLKSLMN